MEWDWKFVFGILPTLGEGVIVTVQVTILGTCIAMAVGLILAILSHSGKGLVARLVIFLADFVRGTPLLVQLYFLFYILPDIGILLSPLAAGIIGFGLHYATYTAEVYRAGINNVPRGQWEAAKAVNLTRSQTWLHVVLPQAIPPMVPPMANYFIAMFKETPLLAAITVLELMNQARSIANFHYKYVEPMTLVGLFFLAVSIPAVMLTRHIEHRFSKQES